MHIDKNPKKLILVHVDTRHALERQRDELSLRTEPALTSDFLSSRASRTQGPLISIETDSGCICTVPYSRLH